MATKQQLPSLRAAYAKHILYQSVLSKYEESLSRRHPDRDAIHGLPPRSLPEPKSGLDGDGGSLPVVRGKVCIVGAGAAGLHTALLLREVGIDFDILESSNRVGGRCFTYRFPDDPKHPCPHNYYDVGAMRIPDIPVMESMFALLDYLEIKPVQYKLHNKESNEPCMYNYRPTITNDIDNKRFSDMIRSIIDTSKYGCPKPKPDAPLQDADGWLNTFNDFIAGNDDNMSTRQWLMSPDRNFDNPKYGPMTYAETELAETYDTSTGLFDQAFTETICDFYDFDSAKNDQWHRVEGGMQTVTDTMEATIKTPKPEISWRPVSVTKNAPVVAITENPDSISVTSIQNGKKVTTDYLAVFNTTTMGCLERMDTSGLTLSDDIRTGIRALSYDRSTKVAIKFSQNWWAHRIPDGGVSSSDLPVSNVVYPSWNDGVNTSTVLMVSYTWAQDATRMGALVPDYTKVEPCIDDEVVVLCLQNLVKLWQPVDPSITYERLRSLYVTHHAYAWSHDQHMAGAFALFGPGQFKNLYPAFTTPQCGNKFMMCGEAVSAHHAWISGALDSSYVSVIGWLCANGLDAQVEKIKQSCLGAGKGRHSQELDMTTLLWKIDLAPDGIAPEEEEDLSSIRQKAQTKYLDPAKFSTMAEIREVGNTADL